MKLKTIRKSHKPAKKYDAVFVSDSGKEKVIPFGAMGYSDYTIHKNKTRRARYLHRHNKHEDWNKPDTPGALSKWLLWGENTSFRKNVRTFKKKFNL